jgi:hypothetical protein
MKLSVIALDYDGTIPYPAAILVGDIICGGSRK